MTKPFSVYSSVVEQIAHNDPVAGSIPATPTRALPRIASKWTQELSDDQIRPTPTTHI